MRSKYVIFTTILLSIVLWFSCLLAAEYFPNNVQMPTRSKEALNRSYSKALKSMEEPALWPLANDVNAISYRLIYSAAFHGPVALRLCYTAKKGWVLVIKRCDYSSTGEMTLKVNRKKIVGSNEVDQFRKLFDSLDFFQLPTAGALEAENVLDGTSWILEGVENGQYHLIRRVVPKDGDKAWDSANAKDYQKMRDEEGYPFIDRATSAEVNKKLVALGEFLERLSGLELKVH